MDQTWSEICQPNCFKMCDLDDLIFSEEPKFHSLSMFNVHVNVKMCVIYHYNERHIFKNERQICKLCDNEWMSGKPICQANDEQKCVAVELVGRYGIGISLNSLSPYYAFSFIHDNRCDFKIGRPPYLPDLEEGAYLFGGWWGFHGLNIHPRDKLWGGQMTTHGLFELLYPYVLQFPSNITHKTLKWSFSDCLLITDTPKILVKMVLSEWSIIIFGQFLSYMMWYSKKGGNREKGRNHKATWLSLWFLPNPQNHKLSHVALWEKSGEAPLNCDSPC